MLLRISFLFLAISALAASAKRPNYHRSAPINPRLRLSSSSSGPNEARDNSAVTCYTNTNAAGYYQDYDDYTSSLGSYDNSFRSACMYGIWMWYDLEDYNYADFNASLMVHFIFLIFPPLESRVFIEELSCRGAHITHGTSTTASTSPSRSTTRPPL